MTQYLKVDSASKKILVRSGWPDAADFIGPPTAMPDAEDGAEWVACQEPVNFSAGRPTPTSVLAWLDGALGWLETATLADAISAALTTIDGLAEGVRLAALTENATKSEEYSQAETQAKAWAAVDFAGDAPPDVASWAAAKWRDEMTPRQAADDILATAERYRAMLSGIRALRLRHMEDARHATEPAQAEAAVTQFRTTLSALMAGQQ